MNECEHSATGADASNTIGRVAPLIDELSHNDRLTARVELPVVDRMQTAQAAVAALVSSWRLPALRSQRWLAAAGPVLADPAPLELFVQLDRVSQILTLELWQDGLLVFGIDDWVGF